MYYNHIIVLFIKRNFFDYSERGDMDQHRIQHRLSSLFTRIFVILFLALIALMLSMVPSPFAMASEKTPEIILKESSDPYTTLENMSSEQKKAMETFLASATNQQLAATFQNTNPA